MSKSITDEIIKDYECKGIYCPHETSDTHYLIDDKDFLSILEQSIQKSIKERDNQIFRKIKNYDFKEKHSCAFNDGKEDCECFVAGLNTSLKLLSDLSQK